MAAKAIKVEQLKQILKLKQDGFSIKAIARHTGVARNTVRKYLSKLRAEDASLSNKELSQLMYNQDEACGKSERYRQLIAHFQYAERDLDWSKVASASSKTTIVLCISFRRFANFIGYPIHN